MFKNFCAYIQCVCIHVHKQTVTSTVIHLNYLPCIVQFYIELIYFKKVPKKAAMVIIIQKIAFGFSTPTPLQKSLLLQKQISFVPVITKLDSFSSWHLLSPEIVVLRQPFSTPKKENRKFTDVVSDIYTT